MCEATRWCVRVTGGSAPASPVAPVALAGAEQASWGPEWDGVSQRVPVSHLLPPSRPTHRGLRREPLPLPTPEEEANLSSCCCHGDHFTSVHMLGTCVCPAPHVSAHPHPHGPRHGGEGATGSAGRAGGGQAAAGDSLTVAVGRGVGSWPRCPCAEGRRLPDWPGACVRAHVGVAVGWRPHTRGGACVVSYWVKSTHEGCVRAQRGGVSCVRAATRARSGCGVGHTPRPHVCPCELYVLVPGGV